MVNPNNTDKPNFYNDLDEVLNTIWDLLIIGKSKAKSEFHQGYISTITNDFPSIRTVVLRHVNKSSNTISFHTDFRSKKIDELNNNKKVSMLFYDHGKKIQIKISGNAEIHNMNHVSKVAWEQSKAFSKKCYIVKNAPGSLSDNPTSGYLIEHEKKLPENEILESGYKNFTMVTIQIASIEWLYLHRDGHRRAFFKYNNKNLIEKNWLTP